MPDPHCPLPVAEPRLTTDGLVLRAWDAGDLPALVAAGVDPAVRRFRYSIPTSHAQAQQWLSKLRTDREAGRRVELAIAAAPDLTAVGSVSLQDFAHGTATVRYWVASTARGRGLASCAVTLLAGWAFGELALARLWLVIEPENVASRRVAERCGFVREGRLRSHFEDRGGGRSSVASRGASGGLVVLAVDGSGDVFVVDSGNDRVLELPSGSSTQVTVPGLSGTDGLAVDGSGGLFAAFSGYHSGGGLLEQPLEGSRAALDYLKRAMSAEADRTSIGGGVVLGSGAGLIALAL